MIELSQVDLRNCATTLVGVFEFGIADNTFYNHQFIVGWALPTAKVSDNSSKIFLLSGLHNFKAF
jgi:hypothetical protein